MIVDTISYMLPGRCTAVVVFVSTVLMLSFLLLLLLSVVVVVAVFCGWWKCGGVGYGCTSDGFCDSRGDD